MEQHLRTAFRPAHMLLLLHPPVHQLVHGRFYPRCRYALAFTVFPSIGSVLRSGTTTIRPDANLFDERRPAGIRLNNHYVNIDSVVDAAFAKLAKDPRGRIQLPVRAARPRFFGVHPKSLV